MNTLKLKSLAYHRNGVGGEGFFVAIVEEKEGREKRNMMVIRFPDIDDKVGAIVCAAFDTSLIGKGNIDFGVNSWRGDHYASFMDDAIKDYNRKIDEKYGIEE